MPNDDKKQAWLERLERIRDNEELANTRKINEWLLPLMESSLMNKSLKGVILLSVGCGFGADVDTLIDAGINAHGVEPFSRTRWWHLRRNKDRFIVADGKNLPFKTESFDMIYCAEVIEHVGYEEKENEEMGSVVCNERERFAKELTRTLKYGGTIIVSTPNRNFCADIGHGSNFFGIRIHSPFNDFTLSFEDIKTLFLQKGGCSGIITLPYKSFITWDLYTKNYPIIRFLRPLLEIYLKFLDRREFLRASFLSPHLILAIKK